jgi:hypothetical protein
MPEESFWAVTKIDRTTTPFTIEFDYTAEPNWPLAAANELVKKLSKEEGVDNQEYIYPVYQWAVWELLNQYIAIPNCMQQHYLFVAVVM